MTHLMKRGKLCGLPDGHTSNCRTVEAVAKKKAAYVPTGRPRGRAKASDAECRRAPYFASYYQDHKEDYVTRSAKAHAKLRDDVLALYGGPECACCGSTHDPQIDHIHGGGTRHLRDMFKGRNTAFYRWLRDNHPYGFQVLCSGCNESKADRDSCQLQGHMPAGITIPSVVPVALVAA